MKPPRVVLVVVLGLALASCVSLSRFKEAQAAFNQAAAAETRARFETVALPGDDQAPIAALGEGIEAVARTRASYAAAVAALDKLSEGERRQLQADGLWGSALTIKALAHWRLGKFDAARLAAAEALRVSEDLGERDRALLTALPGLIQIDEAYRLVEKPGDLRRLRALLEGPEGAPAKVQGARAGVPPEHPVQVYLLQAKLAAYRNLVSAHARAADPAERQPSVAAREEAQRDLNELAERLAAQSDRVTPQARDQLVRFWQQRCRLAAP